LGAVHFLGSVHRKALAPCGLLWWWRCQSRSVVPTVLHLLSTLVRPARVLVSLHLLRSGYLVTGGLTSRLLGRMRLRRLLHSGYLVTGGLTSRLPGRWRPFNTTSPLQWLPGHWRYHLATTWLLEVLVDALPPRLDPLGWRPSCGCIPCCRHTLVSWLVFGGGAPLYFLLFVCVLASRALVLLNFVRVTPFLCNPWFTEE
jgi:hypothetical protein